MGRTFYWLFAAVLFGCSSSHSLNDGDGGSEQTFDAGGGGAGGGTGNGGDVPEKQLVVIANDALDYPSANIIVFTSAPDGKLLESARTDERGRAVLKNPGNGYVTAVASASHDDDVSILDHNAVSYQVTSWLRRVEIQLGDRDLSQAPILPALTVHVAPVEGALYYSVYASCSYHPGASAFALEPRVVLDDYPGCSNNAPITLWVAAWQYSSSFSELTLMAHQFVTDLSSPTAPVTLQVTLDTAELDYVAIHASGMPGDSRERDAPWGGRVVNGLIASGGSAFSMTDQLLVIPRLKAPVGRAIAHAAYDSHSNCESVSIDIHGSTTRVDWEPMALASPATQLVDGVFRWRLLGDEQGDAVEVSTTSELDASTLHWRVIQPPSQTGSSPAKLDWPDELAFLSEYQLATYVARVHDDDVAERYEQFALYPTSTSVRTTRSSRWACFEAASLGDLE